MIVGHAYGKTHKYKALNKTPGPCMVCGQDSECEIVRYEMVTHSFYITVKVHQRQYIFRWWKCRHRAILQREEDVTRYWEEQDKTGLRSIPYFEGMHPILGTLPKKPSRLKMALVVIGVLLFWSIVILVLDHFGLMPRLPLI
jgi:antibiotic biosynthesis monooxygenase (ABM) superfamily enzyme